MNKLSRAERAQIVRCLVEGNSLRSTARVTGFARNTNDPDHDCPALNLRPAQLLI